MTLILRDKQRSRAYAWEDRLSGTLPDLIEQQSPADITSGFHHLVKLFKVRGFIDVLPDNTRRTQSFHLGGTIVLIPEHRNFPVLCHEFAHLLIWKHFTNKRVPIELHGSEWLTVYMTMLAKFCGFSTDLIVESASRSKLHFYPDIVRKYGT